MSFYQIDDEPLIRRCTSWDERRVASPSTATRILQTGQLKSSTDKKLGVVLSKWFMPNPRSKGSGREWATEKNINSGNKMTVVTLTNNCESVFRLNYNIFNLQMGTAYRVL